MASLCHECTHPLLVSVPDDNTIDSLCVELVIKINHTMSNDFLTNTDTLESIRDDKGIDAQVSLRDELKS